MENGFSETEAINALEMFVGNVDAAIANLKDVVLASKKNKKNDDVGELDLEEQEEEGMLNEWMNEWMNDNREK